MHHPAGEQGTNAGRIEFMARSRVSQQSAGQPPDAVLIAEEDFAGVETIGCYIQQVLSPIHDEDCDRAVERSKEPLHRPIGMPLAMQPGEILSHRDRRAATQRLRCWDQPQPNQVKNPRSLRPVSENPTSLSGPSEAAEESDPFRDSRGRRTNDGE